MPAAEAAAHLGICIQTIHQLLQRKQLTEADRTGMSLRHGRFVRRADVLALEQQWRVGVVLDDAVTLLGLPDELVLDLVAAGLLVAVRGPTIDGSHPLVHRWTFRLYVS
jgi:hypothetical protein